MTTIGSAVPVVKAALVELWTVAFAADPTRVSYDPPMDIAETGSNLEFVYFGDASATSAVGCSGTPVTIDEDATLVAVCEVIQPTSAGTQAACDTRANTLLSAAVGVVLADPTCGVDLAEHQLGRLTVVPVGWDLVTGAVTDRGGHAARFDVTFSVEARLQHS